MRIGSLFSGAGMLDYAVAAVYRKGELLLGGLVRTLLPTPTSCDYKPTSSPSDLERHSPGLGAVTAHFPALLPTPAAADGQRGQDYARSDRVGSGGDDLVTAIIKHQLIPLSDLMPVPDTVRWGKYANAIHRWEAVVGPAPAPTELNSKGNPRLNPAFSEWMMGWPSGWVTDSAIGISRNDQLRIVGNGVCPQQAAAALRYLLAVAA